jgi:hypothetical protein
MRLFRRIYSYLNCSFLTCSAIFFCVGCDASSEGEFKGEAITPGYTSCAVERESLARCPRPWLPRLVTAPLGGVWTLDLTDQAEVEVGYTQYMSAEAPDEWTDGEEIKFSVLGPLKVFMRGHGDGACAPFIDTVTYRVVDAYSPGVGEVGFEGVDLNSTRLIGWASEIEEQQKGGEVEEQFQIPERALGPANGTPFDVTSLGSGGTLTLRFDPAIADGDGPDFAVFENSFNDTFLELAYVEVSSDGLNFTRIPSAYLGREPIGRFQEHDPELIDGLAGKHRGGYGTPFDLYKLAWSPAVQGGTLDLHDVAYVRLVDVIGDGQSADHFGHPIYDPYPTASSAGFDIDAIGVLHSTQTAPCP